ncbi:MAG TPA: SIMPL domain-containing protein [Pyrinomonadaceae bacterium]|nr:SIMPL domain-containing protein [Pyrinomonadaceae bacterium]
MRRRIWLLAASVAMLSLMFVGQATATAAQEITVRGQLGRTVEPGGWLINSTQQKYLLLNADRWRNESWFREGAGVEATGEVRRDVVTTQMEGTPFQARTLRPADGGGGASDSSLSLMAGATRVVVSGDALVQARPDTAMISVAVVTQAQTALAAQQENARRSEAMVRALKAAAGAGAEVETSGYSLQPQYTYRENQQPLIRGYEARNTVTVTLGDLTKVGTVIDAATEAGANNIDSLSFTLRRDEPARDEALAAATREALRKAQVMAQALGGRVGRILEVQEASAGRPVPVYDVRAMRGGIASEAMQAKTPVEIGTLDIRAQVQLVAEIISK